MILCEMHEFDEAKGELVVTIRDENGLMVLKYKNIEAIPGETNLELRERVSAYVDADQYGRKAAKRVIRPGQKTLS